MASPLFKLQPVPAREIKAGQVFDIRGDGNFAILAMEVDDTLVPGKIVVVGANYNIHVIDLDLQVYMLRSKPKRK